MRNEISIIDFLSDRSVLVEEHLVSGEHLDHIECHIDVLLLFGCAVAANVSEHLRYPLLWVGGGAYLHGGSFSVKQRSCFLQFHKFYHEREHALLTGHEIGDHCLEDHKFPALQLPVERSKGRFIFHKVVLDHPFLFYSMRQMECLCPKPEDGI